VERKQLHQKIIWGVMASALLGAWRKRMLMPLSKKWERIQFGYVKPKMGRVIPIL